ncbi:MAG TPA: methyltransferase domain-containing protein [Casimicrobiaceae bacterium]|nr:methyltransferase domain-containing protein [Casimicrobiaceae bacterium]
MHARSFVAFALVLVLVAATPVVAQDFPKYGDEIYQPQYGQAGKDVIWIPTPDALVTRMLQMAKVTDQDLVYDLGAGDGKIPIAAAKQFGARAVGIEYNPDMAGLAKRNAERAGVADKVTIIHGDIFKEDFTKATVITLYLLPALNQQLRPQILKMKAGTRVVSHAFHMGEWEPDDVFQVEARDGFLWIVPASVEGRWNIRDQGSSLDATVDITQKFQRIGGTITIRGKTQPLLGAYVTGPNLGFTFVDADGGVRSVRATIDGTTLKGTLRFAGALSDITGRRIDL